ncbi:hypothetical protein [Flammeovirga pectinis]|uniref:hypothetical protein n=1 Tax=Flammeovirga pectinis TaxID=2494373 RepID=UPI0012D74695|nr:hypothetical protein [Flammeovirga pectinis]
MKNLRLIGKMIVLFLTISFFSCNNDNNELGPIETPEHPIADPGPVQPTPPVINN